MVRWFLARVDSLVKLELNMRIFNRRIIHPKPIKPKNKYECATIYEMNKDPLYYPLMQPLVSTSHHLIHYKTNTKQPQSRN